MTIHHPLEPDAATVHEMTRLVADFVEGQVATIGEQPAHDLDGVEAIVEAFRRPAPEEGAPLDAIVGALAGAIRKSFNTAGPGYLAFIPGGGLYASALADFIACAVNRYVGVTRAAPALVQIERTVLAWLADIVGYPASASGILTSGGSLANLSAIVAARTDRLPEDFLGGVLYVSEHTHHSIAKAARIAGFPASSIHAVPVDARFRMIPAELARAIRRDRDGGRKPFLVVPTIGTTNTGAIDPVPAIVEIARREGLWVHADAAYGGFFRLVDGGDTLLAGMGDCDSITIDPHKGLFLPYGTGCLLVRERAALRRAHEGSAAYLQDANEGGEDPGFDELSPELSRDFRGLRVWLPMRIHGLGAFRAALAEKLALTRWAYDELRRDARFEIVDEPQLSVVAFRMKDRGDEINAELMRRVNARKRVFLSSTDIHGKYTLRICVLSFRTHREHVEEAVRALREEAAALA